MQWIISVLVVSAALLMQMPSAEARTGALGVWVWRADAVADEAKGRELIDFCKAQGIDTILMQTHFGSKALPSKLEHEDGYRHLLKIATEAGIKVEALDGASTMALAEGRESALKKLDAVLAFQASQPEKERFSAIHYDIEPYTLPRWREGVNEARVIAREMLETYTLLRDRVKGEFPELPVKFDIPAWYDAKVGLAVDFAGSTKLLNEHVQDIADEVVLMSYRRTATGKNSVEEIGRNELAYAAKTGKKLSLALETIELKEDQEISFFGLPAAQFRSVVHELFKELDGKPGFGGLYLHQYDRLKAYLADEEPLFPAKNE
jgi:hypothetical protein